MIKKLFLLFIALLGLREGYAQFSQKDITTLNMYRDSLKHLGAEIVNNPGEPERKNANYVFIKTLVSALKTPNSYLYKFDSVKTISVLNSPDNRFRIFSWHIAHDDGSYRFYGAIQMNTGGPLKLYPLEDYSPLMAHPEDTVTSNAKWYGAQYYTIIPVQGADPHYVLLGWKGYTDRSTKKVIDVLTFRNDKPVLGMPIFASKEKKRNRVVFQYTRQASMLLRYVPGENLIVFDNLAAPDKKSKDKPETYGPDLSYNGYKLKNGRWELIEDLDMRNVPNESDASYIDPKPTEMPRLEVKPVPRKTVQ
ncbi:hypothetical protein [Mucilaginibacter auburnensis]|uniref:Uncharacterized protein n=1 Tax=Mucilaginibacter auburnensis TaxID=1457233 RepID=A0A2H9VVG6_9SPHI|nr:hypothetical protein [Mucilaginibacter auburnensis]PJJ84807.1 hypothetical protein CLV57_1829 [Mucilaginibacter auburnensis]